MIAPPTRTPEDRARIRAEVALAADVLVPAWPIASFIAVNPLGGLEPLGFEAATGRARRALGARGHLPEERFRELHAAGRITDADLRAAIARRLPGADAGVVLEQLVTGDALPAGEHDRTVAERADLLLGTAIAPAVDAETDGWCAAFLDGGQAAWAMPDRRLGLYGAWRAVAARDRGLRRLGAGDLRAAVAALPERPEDTLLAALTALGVTPERRADELRRHLGRRPGWASAIRWRAEHGHERAAPADLTSLLAIRCALEQLLVQAAADRAFGPGAALARLRAVLELRAAADGPGEAGAIASAAGPSAADRAAIWQDAYEEHWRGPLLEAIAGVRPPAPAARPRAQAVFCIDARSEGLRRHLERRGPYETLGFAGFFAIAMRFRRLGAGRADALCPVLLTPRHEVTEAPAPGRDAEARTHLDAERRRAAASRTFEHVQEDVASPFALAEAAGWVLGPQALARTLAPGAYDRLRSLLAEGPAPATRVVVDRPAGATPGGPGLTREEQVALARTALRMMGLTTGFGRLVLLCGHGSRTENNPYEAALDCGACGGNQGGPNARVAAAILNRPHVRDALRLDGVEVPEDTWFVAGQHDTAADTVEIFDRELLPGSHRDDLRLLEADLAAAGAANSAERLARLPGAGRARGRRDARRRARARGRDWAQVRPEWGLARNAAFIVGPRAMTAGLDLDCRTFLHSYEAGADADGSALETILTAPLVVAQWINCQYYFSTVDPERFGAGNKTLHNVVAGLGVLQGPGGDLQLGLPRQGVMEGDRLEHEPLRLLAMIQAPLGRIDDIVRRNPVLQHLIGGAWIALAAREAPGGPWRRMTRGLDWAPERRIQSAHGAPAGGGEHPAPEGRLVAA